MTGTLAAKSGQWANVIAQNEKETTSDTASPSKIGLPLVEEVNEKTGIPSAIAWYQPRTLKINACLNEIRPCSALHSEINISKMHFPSLETINFPRTLFPLTPFNKWNFRIEETIVTFRYDIVYLTRLFDSPNYLNKIRTGCWQRRISQRGRRRESFWANG